MIQYVITKEPAGGARTLVADYSGRVQNLGFASNTRGLAECSGFVPIGLTEAFGLYDQVGTIRARICDTSSGTVYDGRIEDVSINGDGVTITAFGSSRAMGDSPYTALWSMTDAAQFRPTREDEYATRTPNQFSFDTSNRIQIALPQGQIYGNGGNVGGMVYQRPELGSRQIIGVSFDAVVTLPANWLLALLTWQAGFTSPTNTLIDTGIAGTNVINKFYTFAGCDYLEFAIYNNTGGNYLVANAPNVWRVQITNVRLVTATANMVNTTITVAQIAGANVTCTVGSTANMYVGQRLHIGVLAANGEGVIVEQILSSTQFVADFTAAAGVGVNVQAFVIEADEIVKDMRSMISTLNPTQLSASDVLIQSPSRDLLSESYQDMYPSDVLDYLIGLGDNQTTPGQWEWGVDRQQLLYFRPEGSAARTWYIDVSDLEVQRSIDDLWNSVYATYQEAGGRTLRTTPVLDSASVASNGLTRRKQIAVSSTSSVQAGVQVQAALADSANPRARSGVTIRHVFDSGGNRWPLWNVSAGDTCIIRNLPPTLSTAIDRIRVFRLTRAEYQADDDTLLIEPESPLPSLSALLALAIPPAWNQTPWWIQVQQR